VAAGLDGEAEVATGERDPPEEPGDAKGEKARREERRRPFSTHTTAAGINPNSQSQNAP
jgi:hypothetical protein